VGLVFAVVMAAHHKQMDRRADQDNGKQCDCADRNLKGKDDGQQR